MQYLVDLRADGVVSEQIFALRVLLEEDAADIVELLPLAIQFDQNLLELNTPTTIEQIAFDSLL